MVLKRNLGRTGEHGLFKLKSKVTFESSVAQSNDNWNISSVQELFSRLSGSREALSNMQNRHPSPMNQLAVECLEQLDNKVKNVLEAPGNDEASSISLR